MGGRGAGCAADLGFDRVQWRCMHARNDVCASHTEALEKHAFDRTPYMLSIAGTMVLGVY